MPMIPTLPRSSTSSAARRQITARAFPITHDADEKAIRLHTPAFSMEKRAEHDSPPVLASGYEVSVRAGGVISLALPV